MAVPFMKRVMSTPKMRALKRKRNKSEADRKKLAGEFKRLLKTESRRLAKQIKTKKKKSKKRK